MHIYSEIRLNGFKWPYVRESRIETSRTETNYIKTTANYFYRGLFAHREILKLLGLSPSKRNLTVETYVYLKVSPITEFSQADSRYRTAALVNQITLVNQLIN